MSKRFVLCVAAALLVASAAWAAEETGTITAVDPAGNTFTIQTEAGDRIVYRTDASTRMMQDGSTVQLGDLAVGARVEVSAPDAEGTAQRVASQVELVSDETADRGTRMTGEAEVGPGGAAVRAEAGARTARAERLPTTASPLPLIGLLGAGALAAGLLVRSFRR